MPLFIVFLFAVLALKCPLIFAVEKPQDILIPLPREISTNYKWISPHKVSINIPAWKSNYENLLSRNGFEIIPYSENSNVFTIEGSINDRISNPEGYILSITENGITIEAKDASGIYWALTTLQQLIQKDDKGIASLPECRIVDFPAFPYRGVMIDAGRTFLSTHRLKRIIEEMSRMKLNVFHWHLTENQGWRLESKIFPQLNDSSNMTRDSGKFYTQDEARHILNWCKGLNVMLIPEIDMPGHSAAFKKTFGFDMQSPEGINVLKQLLDEALEVFEDCEYFHIGTDEVKFTNPDFVNEMVDYLRSKGKKVISWNPGFAYQPGEIDLLQLWSYRGKPLDGTKAVDSRFHYINHFDTYADIRALYRSKIYSETSATDQIRGAEIALWNDRYLNDEDEMISQNNLYPAMMALAERTWDGGGSEYFDSLGTNYAPKNSDDFKAFENFENRMLRYKNTYLSDLQIPYAKQSHVNWLITDAFPNNGDLTMTFPPENSPLQEEYDYNGIKYGSREATGAGIYLRHVWGDLVPSFYSDPQPNHTTYAMTRVYSPVRQKVGLQFETQNYSRSEPDLPAPPGKWDYRESKLWINGEEIRPPEWSSAHNVKDNEISLTNENMASRPPIPITLNEGWNEVLIKLPVGEFSTPETRLVKWMFTFNLTTPDGTEAAPGIVYQP